MTAGFGLDKYDRNARLKPALIAALPAAWTVMAWSPGNALGWGGLWGLIVGAGGTFLLAQMAGRKRLVEVNAKISLGETSAALVGPGMAGGLIQALTAPFAIVFDAFAFFISAGRRFALIPADGRRHGLYAGGYEKADRHV